MAVDRLSVSSRFFAFMLSRLPLHCCVSTVLVGQQPMGLIKPGLFDSVARFDRFSSVQSKGVTAIFLFCFELYFEVGPHTGVGIVTAYGDRWGGDRALWRFFRID